MSAITQIEKEIIEAVVFLRENNHTIPSQTIEFMKIASIEKLNSKAEFGLKVKIVELENLCSEAMGEQPKEWRDRFKEIIKHSATTD